MDPTQPVDRQALTLSRAIALKESGGKDILGDNDTAGGVGQWSNQINGVPTALKQGQIPANFRTYAQKYGTDPNDFSQANQEKTLYAEVNYKKNVLGWSPAQIAASHNAGDAKAENGSWQTNVGTTTLNGKQIHYDTPTYVKDVKEYYDQLSGASQPSGGLPTGQPAPESSTGGLPQAPQAPQPLLSAQDDLASSTPTPPADNLFTDLGKRVQEGSQAASEGISAAAKGDVLGTASGALQTVGAAAGGVGDVVNRALELVPGVKQVENLLGQGVGTLAKTSTGQKVVQSIQDFSDKNPELAKDVGAGFNILTAIPILRGLGVAGDVAGDAISQSLKGVAEKSFVEAAPDIIGSTKAGARFMDANPTIPKAMVDRRLVGDIVNGEFSTKQAASHSWDTIKDMNSQVNKILERPEFATEVQDGQGIAQKALDGFTDRTGQTVEGIPQSGMSSSDLIANAKKLDPNNKLLWDKFEAGQANWKEINELRSSLDSKVKKVYIGKASIDSPDVITSKENGALLSGAMRDSLQTAIPQTSVPFGEMTTQFKIQKALELMNGKKVKPGGLAKFAGHVAGMGTGGAVGGLMGGVPGAVIGGMVGDRAAGAVASKLAGKNIVQGVLKRTGANAVRTPLKKIIPRVAGMVAASESQKANKP